MLLGVMDAFITCLWESPAVVGRPPGEKGANGSGIRIVLDMVKEKQTENKQGYQSEQLV
jgi:hypothetical protein